MTMTKDQIRETAFRLYRLSWRFPEQAPIDEHLLGWESTKGFARYYSVIENGHGVHVIVDAGERSPARAWVRVCLPDGHAFIVEGTAGYVETALRSIPAEMRPHSEASK